MKLPKMLRRKLVRFARKQLLPDVEPELKKVLATLERLEMSVLNMQDLQGADNFSKMYYEKLGEFLREWQRKADKSVRYVGHTVEGQNGNLKPLSYTSKQYENTSN